MQFLRRSARWGLVAVWALGMAMPVAAQEVPGGGGWSAGTGAVGDSTINGFIDLPPVGGSIAAGATFHVSGWIVDTTAEGWAGVDGVQVLNGGTVLGQAAVGLNRPDVASATGNPYWAASGFDAVLPSRGLPSGGVTLTVAAHTPGKGTWLKQVSVTVAGGGGSVTTSSTSPSTGLVLSLVFPKVGDEILANNNGVIRGIAYDTRTRAELGVGVDRVQVYLDGARDTQGSQNIGTAVQTDNTWSLDWQPTKYDHVKHHVLWVYAHSNVTGEERLLQQEISID